ncbi:actin-related protein 8-like isoform X2 [Zophobas morio]|uniref:actin-related protein 8-like isoform X2 n=1 Tax=Zophobas morio TaxID=2755281 RepID=UPI0030827A5E
MNAAVTPEDFASDAVESGKSDSEDIHYSNILVIEPGSKNLKFGLAHSVFPHVIPHVLARRLRTPRSCASALLERNGGRIEENKGNNHNELEKNSQEKELHEQTVNFINENYKFKPGFRKPPFNTANITAFNMSCHPETVPHHLDDLEVPWVDLKQEGRPELLVGEEVFLIENDDYYETVWPIKKGNTDKSRSVEFLRMTLYQLWTRAFQKYLNLSAKNLEEYHVVLVVPNTVTRKHVKLLCEVVMDMMRCRAVLVHQQALCATFGAGVPSACVVDIGAETTSVCCVEDGSIVASSNHRLDYGGDDVTRALYYFLSGIGFPYATCDPDNRLDWCLLDEIKQHHCHLNENAIRTEIRHFHVRRPNKKTQKYSVKFAEEVYRSALVLRSSMFYTEPVGEVDHEDILEDGSLGAFHALKGNVLSSKKEELVEGKPTCYYCKHPLCRQNFESLRSLRSHMKHKHVIRTEEGYFCDWENCARYKKPFAHKPSIISHLKIHMPDSDIFQPSALHAESHSEQTARHDDRQEANVKTPSDPPVDLESTICYCLQRLSDDSRKKLQGCVLLSGGGLLIRNFAEALQARLNRALEGDHVATVVHSRDIEPPILAWKGASILARLNHAVDLWVPAEKWKQRGLTAVREASPVVFNA